MREHSCSTSRKDSGMIPEVNNYIDSIHKKRALVDREFLRQDKSSQIIKGEMVKIDSKDSRYGRGDFPITQAWKIDSRFVKIGFLAHDVPINVKTKHTIPGY